MGNTLGERLKQLVREKGMEQQEVAAVLRLNSATFNGYISNNREPSNEKLKLFADYFGVTVDYLIGRSETRDPYLKHLSPELNRFVREPENAPYLELAMDIKNKTHTKEKKFIG